MIRPNYLDKIRATHTFHDETQESCARVVLSIGQALLNPGRVLTLSGSLVGFTLMGCMCTALQTWHWSLSTIFLVVLAFLWKTGFV